MAVICTLITRWQECIWSPSFYRGTAKISEITNNLRQAQTTDKPHWLNTSRNKLSPTPKHTQALTSSFEMGQKAPRVHLPTQESLCSSNPAEHTHLPMGTSHSPSALQYILGVSRSSAWSTHRPLTSTRDDESAPVTTSVNTARLRLTPAQRL